MFKVASYNIKCGSMTGFDYSMQGLDLKNAEADIAGIQEVDERTEKRLYRNNGIAQHILRALSLSVYRSHALQRRKLRNRNFVPL